MIRILMKIWATALCIFISILSFSQSQTCPVNINFSQGTLTHWWAYTGNNGANGNVPSDRLTPTIQLKPLPITEQLVQQPSQNIISPLFRVLK